MIEIQGPLSAKEVFNSLNYFDEVAIAQVYGKIVALKEEPFIFMRALYFTILLRKASDEGVKHAEAKASALEKSKLVTIGELESLFSKKDDDDNPEAQTD